jgi:anti-sigma factor RsiW
MRCEEVRQLLPELAEGELREAGPVEAHLASCVACSGELRRYRMIVLELASLRENLVEPADGFLERMLALAPASRWRVLTRRAATDGRVQVAAASVGGLLVGAAALGLMRRRAARRDPSGPATADAI